MLSIIYLYLQNVLRTDVILRYLVSILTINLIYFKTHCFWLPNFEVRKLLTTCWHYPLLPGCISSLYLQLEKAQLLQDFPHHFMSHWLIAEQIEQLTE